MLNTIWERVSFEVGSDPGLDSLVNSLLKEPVVKEGGGKSSDTILLSNPSSTLQLGASKNTDAGSQRASWYIAGTGLGADRGRGRPPVWAMASPTFRRRMSTACSMAEPRREMLLLTLLPCFPGGAALPVNGGTPHPLM